jgi:predicted adenine nucleotide alpha hydrolase (AANH) superfamily ATPase
MNSNLAKIVSTVNELEDLEEISSIISLFFFNANILPGSEHFDDVLERFCELINENIKVKTIAKLKEHLDEYE